MALNSELLRSAREARLYSDYELEMSAAFDEAGWIELESSDGGRALAKSHGLLTYAIPAAERRDINRSVKAKPGFTWKPEQPKIFRRPSALQFFYDLFQLGEADGREYNEVLVSYLHLDGSQEQTYELYSCDSFGDIEILMDAIKSEPALIFAGRFQSRSGSWRMPLNTQESQQRTLNGLCVDLDPSPAPDGTERPMDASVLHAVLASDAALMPSYICLTGRGLHLWYIFPEPVQTFRSHNPRRAKLKALSRALYSYWGQVVSGLPCVLDTHCSSLNHGFRAPGSLTKRGELVRAFCPAGRAWRHSTVHPLALSHALGNALGDLYPAELRLSEEDVRWKSYAQISEEAEARQAEYEARPASEDQLAFIADLHERGCVKDSEFATASELNAPGASILIQRALKRRDASKSSANKIPARSAWRTRPHTLPSGSNGGVYQKIYDALPQVPIGKRYLSLYMLAGVAYMMSGPKKPKREVEEDFADLLSTPWAKEGSPLTRRDVQNACMGYCRENWQTRDSICRALGFDPFGEPAKRNGRTRAEHLATFARVASGEKRRGDAVAKLSAFLAEDPSATKNAASRALCMSKSTVSKYWQEACAAAGVEDVRTK